VTTDDSSDAAHWLVRGRVQGVGFRWFVCESARELGLGGDVRNLPDGAVEVRAAGDAAALARLRHAVERGPRGARVDAVEAVDVQGPDWKGKTGFSIRH
jgi:acylphosphatase